MTEAIGGLILPGQSSGSGLPATGAKGDILVFTGTVWTQLPKSADGFVIGYDSTTLTGLKGILPAGLGTVTSVGLSLPGEFSVSGSPVIAAGVLTAGWGSQAANKLFASPDNASGTPAFRAMVLRDVPNGGTSGQPLLAGASIPAYGALNLAQATAITGALPLANVTDGGTAGIPLVAGGAGGDPSYTALALGQATAVSGQLAIANGGTGQATKTEGFDALAPTTTKGDVIVSNGTDNVRQAVGANGTALVADSTQAAGVKWALMTMKQVEVDFGATPTAYKTFTVTDTDVTTTTKILPVQAGDAPTGKSADENEMDPIVFSANPAAGSFTLNAAAQDGPVVGKFKVNYMLAA